MDRESAVSRNFLLALILSMAIIVIAVVIALLLFPPAPGGIPSFSANAEISGGVVYLYHDGGDDLFEGSTVFLFNGRPVPRNAVTFLHGQDWPWTEGETIRLDQQVAGPPEKVEVVYVRGDDRVVVYSHSWETTPTLTPPVTGVPGSISPSPSVTSPGTTIPTIVTTRPTPQPTELIPPEARFSGNPREGSSPLTVQFEDLSTGSPNYWLWKFGDGRESPERNPTHLYVDPGDYTVSLTVSNGQVSNTRIQSSFITVKKPVVQDIYLKSSTASVLPGGSFRFMVTGPGGLIKIGGKEYAFRDGDRVELYPGDVTSGTVTVNEGGIFEFSFSDVLMMVNGAEVRKGIVSDISIPDYGGLSSTMTIVVPSPDPVMELFVDEVKVKSPGSGKIVLAGIGPDSSGKMHLSTKVGSLSFTGSADVSASE